MAEHKFPTEVIDLPSLGKLYPKDSPLAKGKLELKYMTTREEDILMSENLIKKGIVIVYYWWRFCLGSSFGHNPDHLFPMDKI